MGPRNAGLRLYSHRAGAKMLHEDMLSRNMNVLTVEGNSFARNLALNQDADEHIIKLRKELEKKEMRWYETRDGIVYRKVKDCVKFYIPSAIGNHVMYKYYDEFSHVSLAEVLENIRRNYWFSHTRTKVKKH